MYVSGRLGFASTLELKPSMYTMLSHSSHTRGSVRLADAAYDTAAQRHKALLVQAICVCNLSARA